jgi:hypothetical protein
VLWPDLQDLFTQAYRQEYSAQFVGVQMMMIVVESLSFQTEAKFFCNFVIF